MTVRIRQTKIGTDSQTHFFSEALWKGKKVWVDSATDYCWKKGSGHRLEVVHHYGDNGEHYCPTMFLMCELCGGIAEEPEPYECNRWGGT